MSPMHRTNGVRQYLEDLRVGQRFTSGTYRMEESRTKAFAAEFDPQPFHLDEAAARARVFAFITVKNTTVNQNGEPVFVFTVKLLSFKRAASKVE
jgi:acyl dehydratase